MGTYEAGFIQQNARSTIAPQMTNLTISSPLQLAQTSTTQAAEGSRQLKATDVSQRDLNSALRIVFFAHPRQGHIDESRQKIDAAPLSEANRQALKKNVEGPLGIGREDNKAMVKLRSPRLTSGQIADEMISHIDQILAKGSTVMMSGQDASMHAITVADSQLSEAEKAELVRYKEILSFFKKTTAPDFSLSTGDIQKCLGSTGFCVIHGTFPKDDHSEALLLTRSPAQLMHLNNLNEEKRPVPESQDPVGGNKLQWNKLYVLPSAEKFAQAQKTIVDNRNGNRTLFTDSDAHRTGAVLANEKEHGQHALYNRQFTRPPIGYGCEFKTVDDMEGVILSSDLRSKMQKHMQALACLAMKEKGLSPGQPIPEDKIWSSEDFPKKGGAPARSSTMQRLVASGMVGASNELKRPLNPDLSEAGASSDIKRQKSD